MVILSQRLIDVYNIKNSCYFSFSDVGFEQSTEVKWISLHLQLINYLLISRVPVTIFYVSIHSELLVQILLN